MVVSRNAMDSKLRNSAEIIVYTTNERSWLIKSERHLYGQFDGLAHHDWNSLVLKKPHLQARCATNDAPHHTIVFGFNDSIHGAHIVELAERGKKHWSSKNMRAIRPTTQFWSNLWDSPTKRFSLVYLLLAAFMSLVLYGRIRHLLMTPFLKWSTLRKKSSWQRKEL